MGSDSGKRGRQKARIALLGDFALNYNYHPKGGRAADLNASHFFARFPALPFRDGLISRAAT